MVQSQGIEFEDRLGRILQDANIPFKREVSIGGLRVDFLLEMPNGEKVIVEAKSWSPNQSNQRRALDQVEHYKKATGARIALVVF